jgi:hypothetical protein
MSEKTEKMIDKIYQECHISSYHGEVDAHFNDEGKCIYLHGGGNGTRKFYFSSLDEVMVQDHDGIKGFGVSVSFELLKYIFERCVREIAYYHKEELHKPTRDEIENIFSWKFHR